LKNKLNLKMNNIEYVTGQKQLIFNNYLFSATTNIYSDGRIRWKCTTKYNLIFSIKYIILNCFVCYRNCNSCVRILEKVVVKQQDKLHDHPPLSNCEKDVYLEIKAFKERISKDSTLNPKGEYDKIYEKLLKVYSTRELSEYWKTWNSIRGSIWYHQDKNGPTNPESLEDISFTEEFTQTKSSQPFLR
jgi:hypothetical protein